MLILAHRGLAEPDGPENTTASVSASLLGGADGVEVDLRLTADGVLAVSHDADLLRLTGLPLAVAACTWSVLREAAADSGVQLARVEEVLDLVAGRRAVLEVKQPPPGPAATACTALAVVDQLRRRQHAGAALDVTVSSFSAPLVAAVRALLPPGCGVRTALLGSELDQPAAVLRQALHAGHDEIHPHVLPVLADPEIVAAAHACGMAVVPWSVNRRHDVQRLERLGVDAVITDLPDMARAEVGRAAVRR